MYQRGLRVAQRRRDKKWNRREENIIAGEEIVKEFIQKDFNAQSLYIESKKILTDTNSLRLIVCNSAKRDLTSCDSASVAAESQPGWPLKWPPQCA